MNRICLTIAALSLQVACSGTTSDSSPSESPIPNSIDDLPILGDWYVRSDDRFVKLSDTLTLKRENNGNIVGEFDKGENKIISASFEESTRTLAGRFENGRQNVQFSIVFSEDYSAFSGTNTDGRLEEHWYGWAPGKLAIAGVSHDLGRIGVDLDYQFLAHTTEANREAMRDRFYDNEEKYLDLLQTLSDLESVNIEFVLVGSATIDSYKAISISSYDRRLYIDIPFGANIDDLSFQRLLEISTIAAPECQKLGQMLRMTSDLGLMSSDDFEFVKENMADLIAKAKSKDEIALDIGFRLYPDISTNSDRIRTDVAEFLDD